jgi:hypothetical protein
MSDKIAGIYTQVRLLRKRLKELDTATADPAEISAVADALEKLEVRLERHQTQKKQRQEQKEKMVLEEKKKQEEAQRKQERELQNELDFLKGKTILKEEPKVETPVETATIPNAPTEVINSTPVTEPTPVQSAPASVQAEPAPVEELPLAASTEKKTDLNVFALDAIVEPVRGTPGSWGRVMRYDGPKGKDPLVYVKWEGGKLAESHQFGGYDVKDLRKKAGISVDKWIKQHLEYPGGQLVEMLAREFNLPLREAFDSINKVKIQQGDNPLNERLWKLLQQPKPNVSEEIPEGYTGEFIVDEFTGKIIPLTPKTKASVQAEPAPVEELPLAASTEKKTDLNVFALDSIVEPIKGTPGSWGVVMRHDATDADVYVLWQGGKLKDDHVAGAYSPKDLRMKASIKEADEDKKEEKEKIEKIEPEVFKKEKTEREKREEEFKKKKKDMGLSSRKLSKNDKRANLKCIEDEPIGGTYIFARSVMAKDGIIIPAGTAAIVTQVIGDHFYLSTDKGNFVINRFDTPKLITAQKKTADFRMMKKHNPLGQGEWFEGTTDDGYQYQAKVFQGGSQFGLNEGPISKLWIVDPETKQPVVNYDRGWDIGEELVDVWMPVVEELTRRTQKPETKSELDQPDPMENGGTGYGGDRPGVWVEPKASLKVAQKQWFAQKNDKGYLITDEAGSQICLVQSQADLSKENLEDIVYNELLKRDLLAFSLKKPFALLKAGHKIDVLELDQRKQQFKFVSKEGEASGWAPFDVLNVEVKAIQKKSKIVHKEDGWHVLSESGKNMGGPYRSRSEAEKRLKQVEMFKHMQATSLSKNSDVIVIKKSIIDNLVTNCPECFEKFKKVAKESKLKIKYASESSDNVLEQLQQIRERIQNIKTRTQQPQPPTTQASIKEAEGAECARCDHDKSMHNEDGHCDKCMGSGNMHRFVKAGKIASHPIEEPAVVELIKGIEIDLDTLENMYRDNPDAITHIEQIEDRINELEHKIGIDVPEMPHEIEEGHPELEKETAWKKPKPTTPAPTGFVWVYDEKMGDWVMMTSDTMY